MDTVENAGLVLVDAVDNPVEIIVGGMLLCYALARSGDYLSSSFFLKNDR